LIEARGCCPPEDVGGPFGYAEFLEAIADPRHKRHAEFAEWWGDGFNPNAVNVDAIDASLATLAKKWTRRPAAKPSPRT
jgi:hypothetical protein